MVRRGAGWILTLAAVLGLGTAGCAGSPLGDSVEQSLEADPQLEENPAFEQEESASTPATVRPRSTPTAASTPTTRRSPSPTPRPGPNLQAAPEELRPYLEDLLALDLLSGAEDDAQLEPNQPVTRAQYAQWLLAANNRLYQDQADRRIRPAVESAEPAFQDVPATHPAFEAVQGLAEAGIIPSTLSGSTTEVNFRPDAPLTRKDLLLWKVPLDTHAALPTATAEAVAQAWGFQDAAKIEPLAQRAVLADHQNGEFANIRRVFGFTTLFQPDKAVTQAEAAAALWRFGTQTEGVTAASLRSGQTGRSGQTETEATEPEQERESAPSS